MNVYDTANQLAREIRTSEEYVTYKKAKEYIDLKPELKEKIMDFQKLRYEAQISAMQTGKEDEEKCRRKRRKGGDFACREKLGGACEKWSG